MAKFSHLALQVTEPCTHLLPVTMRGLAAFYFLSALCSAMVLHDKRASAPKGFVNNGPAPPEQSITLRIALASNNIAGLESKLLTISDPSSADYGQWLSQAEASSFL